MVRSADSLTQAPPTAQQTAEQFVRDLGMPLAASLRDKLILQLTLLIIRLRNER